MNDHVWHIPTNLGKIGQFDFFYDFDLSNSTGQIILRHREFTSWLLDHALAFTLVTTHWLCIIAIILIIVQITVEHEPVTWQWSILMSDLIQWWIGPVLLCLVLDKAKISHLL